MRLKLKKLKKTLNTDTAIESKHKSNIYDFKEFPFDILTNSSRSSFLNCRQKFYWQYICHLSPISTPLPFLVGGLFHDGLERFYDGRLKFKKYRLVVQKAINDALEFVRSDKESETLWQQEGVIMGMLKGYVKRYKDQDFEQWEVIAPETDFVFDLPNGMRYAGKRDLLVKSRKAKSTENNIILVEHKTTSYLTPGYIAKLPLDNQILIYSKSVELDYKMLPTHIVYNVIKKTMSRQRQNETLDQYITRVEQEYKDNSHTYFYREIVPVSPKVIADSYKELCACSDEVKRCIDTGYYYKNTTQCTAFGTCPYMPLCLKDKQAKHMYQVRENLHAELDIEEK